MSETNNLSNFTISTGKIDSLLILAYPAPKSSIAIENLLALSFNNVSKIFLLDFILLLSVISIPMFLFSKLFFFTKLENIL